MRTMQRPLQPRALTDPEAVVGHGWWEVLHASRSNLSSARDSALVTNRIEA
jgi:hypothetical protein